MSAPAQSSTRQTTTRIFGIPLALDPKILVGALVAMAALLFWYNSRGDDSEKTTPAASRNAEIAAVSEKPASETKKDRAAQRRRSANKNDNETLRLRNIDGTRGDIDPELRLDLLAGLQKVKLPAGSRNLFEEGPAAAGGLNGVPVRKIVPTALQTPVIAPSYPIPSQLTVNIPYKYYGFVKPQNPGESNRGFFLEGDNILVGLEGQLLQQRYLVVQLSPGSARLQDTQLKREQTLPVVPEAVASEGGGYGSSATGMGLQSETNEEMQEQEQPQQPMRMNPGMGPGMRQPIRGGFISPNNGVNPGQQPNQ
ncbi:MAG TPA: hypothetical protein VHZ55_33290 [Bryobacteraceae bacterium]|jgi:hypothetical protein|nr:hypothetical protein [Bryobacteraceae bacterium]